MNQSNNLARRSLGHAALLVLALHAAGCGGKDDKDKEKKPTAPPPSASQSAPPAPASPAPQTAPSVPATPPAPKPSAAPLTSLESLVAPVALYPDPLLAEVLVAATYPFEVVQAARWLETKPDPATLRSKNWDASVSRLTAVPDVIAMMDKHLDWTTQLGDAFLSNPSQLMDAVQTLRKRASDAGFLKDSDLQKVEEKTVPVQEPAQGQSQTEGVKATPAVHTKEVITIQPAKADTLPVPSYNPEVVYAAPMAPPPATYAAAPAASYYPTYYPPPAATTTTTTTSDTDQWMSFGVGAIAGGLLTWGIMEWADDDDWDDYHVSHHYGDAVCHGGNCWSGGGGGYYGGSRYGNANVNRGNINTNRDINISGNEINFNRDGTFSQDQLPALKDRAGAGGRWQPDARHRRGQAFPPQAQQRIGRAESPALAGNRLSGAQSLPANMRGFSQAGVADRAAPARLSSADVQQRLAAKPGRETRSGIADSRPMQSRRENALEGLRASGQRSNFESRRGASSQNARQQGVSKPRTKDLARATPRRSENIGSASQRRSQQAVQRPSQQQQLASRQRNDQMQRLNAQRRQEMSRPNAFGSARDGGRASAYSNRGSSSFARSQKPARQSSAFGGGQRASGRGGGAGRGGGGGGRSRGGRR
jgi:hypothetical protein